MNIIQDKLLSDLEIDNKVIPALDKTITIFGKTKFREMFTILYYDEPYLLRRQQIISSIINSNIKNINIVTKSLKQIKKYQDDVSWLFNPISKDISDLYCSYEVLNTKEILTLKNLMKTYSPSLIIIIYLLIYIIFRYYGLSIDIQEYFYSIYEGYKFLIKMLLTFTIDNEYIISFATNFLATLYVFYQIYSLYNSVDSSIIHYNKCYDFKTKFNNIKSILTNINKIYKNDKFMINEKVLIKDDLNIVNEYFTKANSIGSSLVCKKDVEQIETSMNNLLQYVGLVDAFINISRLVTFNKFVFPTFMFNQTKPSITIDGLWSPYINSYNQVKNDCYLGDVYNNLIITGPNTSGKSTYIRSVILSILLSQTIGVSCCDSIVFTPFKNLFTYLDIPNISRNKESLFEAEIMRCMEYCKILESSKEDEFIFTVIDELFTGTNPKEGIASSYAVCEYVGKFSNSINIFTTHFMELTNLEKDYPNHFKNMNFYVIKNSDGSFTRPYKIKDGISQQHIAIELLKNKGYNESIITNALNKLNNLIV